MKKLKKQQHFVWKHYLKPWTTDDKIFCSRHGRIFYASLSNIAQERFFYESEPLNIDEFNFIISFIMQLHPSSHNSLLELFRMYNITYNNDGYLKKCGIEDFYGIVEKKMISILDKIYNKDLSFLKNEEDKNNFSFYIGCQYTRTSKVRDNLIKLALKSSKNISKAKIAKVLSLLYGDIIGNWVFSKSRISLLINDSDLNFITGDQPIINTKVDLQNMYKQETDGMELYFPISPKIAIYLSEELRENQFVNKNEVENFNDLIFKHSKEQVYLLDNRF